MITMTDTRLQIEKLDQQLISLLADRINLCDEAHELHEGLDDRLVREEMISNWLEEAADQGLPEEVIMKLADIIVNRLCKEEE